MKKMFVFVFVCLFCAHNGAFAITEPHVLPTQPFLPSETDLLLTQPPLVEIGLPKIASLATQPSKMANNTTTTSLPTTETPATTSLMAIPTEYFMYHIIERENNSITLECSGGRIVWFYNGSNGISNPIFDPSIYDDSSFPYLKIKNVTSMDAGKYTCVEEGIIKKIIYLYVFRSTPRCKMHTYEQVNKWGFCCTLEVYNANYTFIPNVTFEKITFKKTLPMEIEKTPDIWKDSYLQMQYCTSEEITVDVVFQSRICLLGFDGTEFAPPYYHSWISPYLTYVNLTTLEESSTETPQEEIDYKNIIIVGVFVGVIIILCFGIWGVKRNWVPIRKFFVTRYIGFTNRFTTTNGGITTTTYTPREA